MALVDGEKNILEGIDISDLFVNSDKRINWKCENGHSFKESVKTVHGRKNKCPYCVGRKVWSGENDLQTLYPELAREFDVEKNGIKPDLISPKDTKSYWWTCANNHPSFFQRVDYRVQRKSKCPYCTGRKVIAGETDLETLFPEIAKEWDVEKNGGIMPKEVSPNSYSSYWWTCPKGHSYKKKVIQRTKFHKTIDCTKCVKAHSTSFPEQAIYYYIKKCFPDAINRYRDIFEQGMELDIYVPTYRLGIEYDGIAFHKDEEQHIRERKKYLICKQLGIRLVRIKDSKNTWNDTADDVFYVNQKMKDVELSMFLRSLFGSLFFFSKHSFSCDNKAEEYLNRYNGFPTDFNVSRDRPKILEYLGDIKDSLGVQYPTLSSMWSESANGNLTPFMFTPGSNYMATWKCPICGNEWKSPISSMVSRNVQTCKTCSRREMGNNMIRQKTEQNGSLAERSKILLEQWDFEENKLLSPYEIPLTYNSKVSWKCNTCGYKWSSAPSSRVQGNRITRCPHCSGRVAMSGVDDFETLYPSIAKEWDYEKNGNILPSEIKPYSNKKYFWKCTVCGNSYAAYPGNRIKGSGCPDCARIRANKKKAKLVGQINEEGRIINIYYGLNQAADAMQVTQNSIFYSIKNGRKSKGYYWRYVREEDFAAFKKKFESCTE